MLPDKIAEKKPFSLMMTLDNTWAAWDDRNRVIDGLEWLIAYYKDK